MRRALLAMAASGLVLALVYLAEALRYARGTLAEPGPGLYPLLVGTLLVLGSLGIGLEAVVQRAHDGVGWPEGPARWRMLALLAASLGYVILLPYLGHPLAGALVTLVVLHVMGLRRWPLKVGLALVVGLGSHYLFTVVLGVPLPVGIWSG